MRTIFTVATRKLPRLHRSVILSFLVLFVSFGQTSDRIPLDITFQSDGHFLRGRFFHGSASGGGLTLILLHGFPGNQQDVLGLGQKLSNAGFNVLTFNYSGTHQSEGEFSMENTLKDIGAAYDYLRKADIFLSYQVDTTQIVLGGYSYGGGMALTYAAHHPEIGRVISIAGTDHGEFAREYMRNREFAQTMDEAFEKLKAPNGPVNFEGKEALKKLAANPAPVDLRISASRLASHDILLLGGWDDTQVTIDDHLLPLYRVLKKAGASKIRFVAYQTDHSFHNVRDELATDLIRWMKSDTLKSFK